MNSSVEAEPVNLGNPAEFTIKELAEQIISLTGSMCRIEHGPLPGDDPKQRCPSISRARNSCNWHPRVHAQAGLLRHSRILRHCLQERFKGRPSGLKRQRERETTLYWCSHQVGQGDPDAEPQQPDKKVANARVASRSPKLRKLNGGRAQ